jgi:integrase
LPALNALGSVEDAVGVVDRYRLGGRDYPLVHGGSFKTQREALERRNLIAGEIAAGRNPKETLRAMLTPVVPVKAETLAEIAPRYETSREIDMADIRPVRSHLRRITAWGGDRDPHSLIWQDAQEFVTYLVASGGMKPASVRRYNDTFKLLLDFAGVDPNPARDGRIRLPRMVREEVNPPTGKQFLAILDKVMKRWVLPFMLQEQCGLHIKEVVTLAWGDVDVAERKIRLRFANVKGGWRDRARMVQVPDWLMEAIEETCPLEDRTAERRVFVGLEESAGRAAMARACRAAGIPHFSPKDLRHRRATIWHHGGLPARVLAERLGHSKPSMSLDVYSHTLDPGEVEVEELQARVKA